jgi:hypothetical protein
MADGRSVTWTTPMQGMRLFLHGVTVATAWRVALVVGTLLSVVNQGVTIAEGEATWGTWVRVAVNYCVPFCVASIGFLSACRSRPATASPGPGHPSAGADGTS